MPTSYATYEEYVLMTGDDASGRELVEAKLASASAVLRAKCRIGEDAQLGEDAAAIAREMVAKAVHDSIVQPALDGFAGELTGVRQASFTANGTTQSITIGSNRLWFSRDDVATLKAALGRSQMMGFVWPGGVR